MTKPAPTADLILHHGLFTTLDRAQPDRDRGRDPGRPLPRRRRRRGGDGAGRSDDQGHRPQGPARPAGADRQPPPHHPRRAQLQHGAALGRRAQPRRRDEHAEAAGRRHAAAAMGARGRRLHRASVRREAAADHRRAQRRRARHAGLPAAPLRPRAPQRRRAARRRLHQGHAEPARRRDRARPGWQSDRAAARQAQCRHPLRDAGQGSEAAVRLSAQLDAPLHARAQPARRHRRDRRRRRLPELSRGLRGHPEAGRRRAAHHPPRLQSLHPEAEGREGRLPAAGRRSSKYKQGDDYFRHNGAGEMLVFSAADFEDFRQPRPDMPPEMERELEDGGAHPGRRTAGRGGCTPPTTRRSAARSTCSSASTRTCRSTACTGSSTTPRPSRSSRSTASRRSAAASPCSTAWPIRASTSSNATVRARPRPRRRSRACWRRASRSPPAPTRRASRPTIRGCRSPGWSPGKTVGGLRIYPQRNCLDRETALRMWTENVTWFSNEEGKKGRIEVGQLADLIVPDRDYFACAESEIADTVVRADDRRRQDRLCAPATSRASTRPRRRRPCRTGRRCAASAATPPGAMPGPTSGRTARKLDEACSCASACGVHGHDHAAPGPARLPVRDLKSFWGALGCSCFAF